MTAKKKQKDKDLICSFCPKKYSSMKCYLDHVEICRMSLIELPTSFQNISPFNFSDDYFDTLNDQLLDLVHTSSLSYLNELSTFCINKTNELKVLHLNINGYNYHSKLHSIHEILDFESSYDIICLNESKLINSTPDSQLSHSKYSLYRRDRNFHSGLGFGSHGGGLIVYIKKNLVHKVEICNNVEALHLTVVIRNTNAHFLICYKSPRLDNAEYLEFLDQAISCFDPNDPLFVIGDLNMDLNSEIGLPLTEFMRDLSLSNSVTSSTRIQTRSYANNRTSTSSTLLDVILHNQNLISSTIVSDCPFSDHKFVSAAIKIGNDFVEEKCFWARNLSEKNCDYLKKKISSIDFTQMDKLDNSNLKWKFITDTILPLINKVAPLQKIKSKIINKTPRQQLSHHFIKIRAAAPMSETTEVSL